MVAVVVIPSCRSFKVINVGSVAAQLLTCNVELAELLRLHLNVSFFPIDALARLTLNICPATIMQILQIMLH